jgi:pyruvate kinase
MQRATKIVATLGPASNTPDILTRMIAAGVDVVRLNFSHGAAGDHEERARIVREVAQKLGRTVAIMADLQGPKIRVGKFADGKVTLQPGQYYLVQESGNTNGVNANAIVAFVPSGHGVD